MTGRSGDRPKFKSAVASFAERQKAQLSAAAMASAMPLQRLLALEDYLHISLVRRSDPFPLFKLQVHVLEDLIYAEAASRNVRRHLDDLQNGRAHGPASLREGLEREIAVYQYEARTLRDVVDGLAWRLFGYDRALIYELADRPGNKHLNMEGLMAEALELEASFAKPGSIALLNDLTHFIKIGDVTVRTADGAFEFTEVKKGGKKSGRITRQKQTMKETIEFLNTGEREQASKRLVITEVNVWPKSYFDAVQETIARSSKEGVSFTVVDDHLSLLCFDFFQSAELGLSPDKLPAASDGIARHLRERQDAGHDLFPMLSANKDSSLGRYAPFSIFPFPEPVRIRLASGALVITAFVNLTSVLGLFEKTGWKIVKGIDECEREAEEKGFVKEMSLAVVSKGELTCYLPPTLVGRIGYEFLRPQTLVEMHEDLLARGPQEETYMFMNLQGESSIWD